MAKQNRSTLKGFFENGRLPSGDQFGDLIDSALNPIDEGFDKTEKNGFEISLIGTHKRLISFFKAGEQEQAVWTIEYDEQRDRLLIRQPEYEREKGAATGADAESESGSKEKIVTPAAMTLSGAGPVGIGNPDPVHELDVGGVVASQGRIGARPGNWKEVIADGEWKDIAGPLKGCHAYEVIAGVGGKKGSGKYALTRAIAMNSHNPRSWPFDFFKFKKRIKCQHTYYGSRGNRIKMRWDTQEEGYYLQVKTACRIDDDVKISCYLTQLWFDPEMRESKKEDTKD